MQPRTGKNKRIMSGRKGQGERRTGDCRLFRRPFFNDRKSYFPVYFSAFLPAMRPELNANADDSPEAHLMG